VLATDAAAAAARRLVDCVSTRSDDDAAVFLSRDSNSTEVMSGQLVVCTGVEPA